MARQVIVARIFEAGGRGLAVSRALDPDLRRQLLARTGTRELPCVRGRTVVPDTWKDTVVVGYPNYLGVFDGGGDGRLIVLTGAWSGLRPTPDDAMVIAIEEAAPKNVAARALGDVRRLAKRLRQLRGVQVAIRPQSPLIVALLPFSPGPGLLALPGVTALEGDFPEYPGGVRIEPPPDETDSGLSRYAGDLERLITEEASA